MRVFSNVRTHRFLEVRHTPGRVRWRHLRVSVEPEAGALGRQGKAQAYSRALAGLGGDFELPVQRRRALTHGVDPYAFRALARIEAHAVVDRKSTRLNSSHANISYAVFCLKKNKINYAL